MQSPGTDPVTGRRRQISRTVRGSRAHAQVVLSKLRAQVDKGAFRGASHELGPYLEHWLEFRSDDLAPRTLEVWRGAVKSRIAPGLGDRPLGKLTLADLDQFYLTLRRREGLSPRTVHHLHAIIHGALKQAVKWGYIASNPADLATLPRQQRRR